MDADDLMHPARLARQLQFLKDHPEVDVVGSGTYILNDANQLWGIRGIAAFDSDPKSILRTGLFIHPTITARREWFLANAYDESFLRSQDRELWCRTCGRSTFASICEPLYFYREDLTGNLRAFRQSSRGVRRAIKMYGPMIHGWLGSKGLIVNTLAKE